MLGWDRMSAFFGNGCAETATLGLRRPRGRVRAGTGREPFISPERVPYVEHRPSGNNYPKIPDGGLRRLLIGRGRHAVEVDAESLFEAAVVAVRPFRPHQCDPGELSKIDVELLTCITHAVTLRENPFVVAGRSKESERRRDQRAFARANLSVRVARTSTLVTGTGRTLPHVFSMRCNLAYIPVASDGSTSNPLEE